MKIFSLQALLKQGSLAFQKKVKFPTSGMTVNTHQDEYPHPLKVVTHYSGKTFHTRTGTRGGGMGMSHQSVHHKK